MDAGDADSGKGSPVDRAPVDEVDVLAAAVGKLDLHAPAPAAVLATPQAQEGGDVPNLRACFPVLCWRLLERRSSATTDADRALRNGMHHLFLEQGEGVEGTLLFASWRWELTWTFQGIHLLCHCWTGPSSAVSTTTRHWTANSAWCSKQRDRAGQK